MEIDVTNAVQKRIEQKKREAVNEENSIVIEKAKIDQRKTKELREANEKTNADIVKISSEGEKMAEQFRNLQKAQALEMNSQQQSQFEKLSTETANRIRELNEVSKSQIHNVQKSTLEKVGNISDRSADPFYRLKSFDATISENQAAYLLNIKLPPHEAKNLFVTSDGNKVKLSLARSYADNLEVEPGHQNRTYSYQTILESFTLPSKTDAKHLTRNYENGVLTINLPKG